MSNDSASPTSFSPVVAVNPSGTRMPTSNTSTVSVPPKSGFRHALEKLLAGIETVIPDGTSMPSSTGAYTKADMVAHVQGWIGLYEKQDVEVQSLKTTRQDVKAALPEAHAYYQDLKHVLVGFFHAGNPQLAQFGFKPKTARPKLTANQKAAAVVKAAETRKLRGTEGPKAKLKKRFTGNVVPAAAEEPAVSPLPALPGPVVGPAKTS